MSNIHDGKESKVDAVLLNFHKRKEDLSPSLDKNTKEQVASILTLCDILQYHADLLQEYLDGKKE